MKIVSYNISDSKPWKIERLLGMDADVWVVPEITCPEDARLPENHLNEALEAIIGTMDTSFKSIKTKAEFIQNLEDNCIPVEILDMDYTNYQTFLEMRRAKMTELIKSYYYSL